MKNFFHILNPNKAKTRAVRRFFDKHAQYPSMWIERKSHPTHLETVVQWAVNEGHSNIAVWGGDGTLNRVVQSLYNLNALDRVSVALVPAGTCNDFARKMEVPSWEKWREKEGKGGQQERTIDVGLLSSGAERRTFLNNAGFGREPSSIGRSSNALRDISAFTDKKLDLEWKQDGATHFETRRALMGIVFNAPYFNCGLHFDKSVEPDDGVLNGFFEGPQPPRRLLLKFLKGRLGGSLAGKQTFRVDFNLLRFQSDKDLYPQVDGEKAFENPVRFLDFSVLPKALRLFMPACRQAGR